MAKEKEKIVEVVKVNTNVKSATDIKREIYDKYGFDGNLLSIINNVSIINEIQFSPSYSKTIDLAFKYSKDTKRLYVNFENMLNDLINTFIKN